MKVPMLDTEGVKIPHDDLHGEPYFALDVCDFNKGNGPELTMNVPQFETENETYCGDGVVFAPLRPVLEAYLARIREIDEAKGRDAFVAWLRDYADRLEKV